MTLRSLHLAVAVQTMICPPVGGLPLGMPGRVAEERSMYQEVDPVIPHFLGEFSVPRSQERGHLGRVLAVIRQQHKGTEMVVPWEPKCGTLWPHSRFLSAKMEWPLAAHTQIFPSFPTVGDPQPSGVILTLNRQVTPHPIVLAKLQAFVGSPEAAWQPSSADS